MSAAIKQYHKIMMVGDNYSMLLGRIYQHQQHLFHKLPIAENLPHTQRTAIVKQIISHHRATYAPFVVAMYSERQQIICDNKATQLKNNALKTNWWKYVTKHIPDKAPERVLIFLNYCEVKM